MEVIGDCGQGQEQAGGGTRRETFLAQGPQQIEHKQRHPEDPGIFAPPQGQLLDGVGIKADQGTAQEGGGTAPGQVQAQEVSTPAIGYQQQPSLQVEVEGISGQGLQGGIQKEIEKITHRYI